MPKLVDRTPIIVPAPDGAPLQAELAWLHIDDARAGADRIRIRVQRVIGNPQGVPLIVCVGGPGGQALWNVAARPLWFRRMSAIGDIYVFDQRGAGESLPSLAFGTKAEFPDGTLLTRESHQQGMRSLLNEDQAQLDRFGLALSLFNVAEIAKDIVDLADAINAPHFNFHGYSFGTQVGLQLLRAAPDRVGRVYFWGVEPLDATWKLPQRLTAHVAAAGKVLADGPFGMMMPDDLVAAGLELRERFDRTPIRCALAAEDGRPARDLWVGGLFVEALFSSTFTRQGIATLPMALKALESAPEYVATRVLGEWIGRLSIPNWQTVLVDRASGVSPERLQQISRSRNACPMGDVPNAYLEPFRQPLAHLELPDTFRAPVEAYHPIYIHAGTLDGNTPLQNALEAMKTLPNAHLCIVDGLDHEQAATDLGDVFTAIEDDVCAFLGGADPKLRSLAYPMTW